MNGPSPGFMGAVSGAMAPATDTYNPAPQGDADAAAFMASSSTPQTGADAARFMAQPNPPPTPTSTPYGTGPAPAGAFAPYAPTSGKYGGAAPTSYFDNSPLPGAPPPSAAPKPGAGGPSPFLQQVHGAMTGTVAAKETELRGPQLLAAQKNRNDAFQGAISAVDERARHTQAAEMALAIDQERKAGIREDAANYSAAERANELAERQNDFDQSVKALSKQSIDPGRYWSNANVGVKLATLIGVALGGFVQGKKGGENAGMNTVKMMIDNDVHAQEQAYAASRDTVNAKQTAFSMAMQKYQNVDAARAAARASALDAASAQVQQQASLWRGADAQNAASMAMATLQSDRMNQVAQGVAFVPQHQVAVGAKYVDPRTGLTYSENEAKGLVAKMDEREEKRDEQNTVIAGQLLVKREEQGQKAQDKADDGAKFVSSQLQQAGVPQARTMAERALKALNESEGGPGEGFVRGALGRTLSTKVLGEKAAEREQAYADFMNSSIKATMGNATENEVERAKAGLADIKDPAGRRRAINAQLAQLSEIEKNARSGASPEAQRNFSDRRANAEGAPPAAPKGSRSGW